MGNHTFSKKCAAVTVFLFAWFCLVPGFLGGREKKPLAEAQALISAGKYEEAAKILNDYIQQYSGKGKRKGSVAEAHYILARMYFEIGEDQKCDANLRTALQYDAELGKDEANPGLRARMDRIRGEVAPQVAEKLKKEAERLALKRARSKKKFPWLLAAGAVAVVVAAVVLLTTKKYYTLTVTTGAGVTGFPLTQTGTVVKGTQITYQYDLLPGYKDLSVKVNGTAAEPSGILVVNRDTTIEAAATAMTLAASLDVDSRDNCFVLDNSLAAMLEIEGGTYSLQISGEARYSGSTPFDAVFVNYFPTSGANIQSMFSIPNTFSISLRGWPITTRFYAFFADRSSTEDNSGETTLDFGTRQLKVQGRDNCFQLETSQAACKEIPAGTYQIRVSGNAFYAPNTPMSHVLIRYRGSDGLDRSGALEFAKTTTLNSGGGTLYAFFVVPYSLTDCSGKDTLEFFKF